MFGKAEIAIPNFFFGQPVDQLWIVGVSWMKKAVAIKFKKINKKGK